MAATAPTAPTSDELSTTAPPPPTGSDEEPRYNGFTRFEMELEFVQALSNPHYLNRLAADKKLKNPKFVAYLDYLQYWSRPPYLKYLTFPGPTLKVLELLQQEQFRQDIISPMRVEEMYQSGLRAAVEWHRDPSQYVQGR